MQRHLPQETAAGQELRTAIEQIRCRMESISSQFEQETDPTLIDCHIYELKAAQLRYQFLLRRVKKLEAAQQEASLPERDTGGTMTCKPGMKKPFFITCTRWG